MQTVSVGFVISQKVIAAEYRVISRKYFEKVEAGLDFTLEEYGEYLNLVLNHVISKSGGIATTPFSLSDTPLSSSLNIAFQSIGEHIDHVRDMCFVPVSQVKVFSISKEKVLSIRAALIALTSELAIINRVPGRRSSELPEVMTSKVVRDVICSIKDSISPSSIVNCSLVQPMPDKNIAFAIQQSVNTEILAYTDKLIRI